jgi:palmitoyltransferase
VRKSGWSLPLHPLQILAWSFILFFSVSSFLFMIPRLPNPVLMWTTGIVLAATLGTHVVIHLISVSCNPADDAVLEKYRAQGLSQVPKLGTFDRSKHEHVIENQFCYICEVSVGPKSKHCSVCNKCVADFDHHCKWLNNCVGAKNYR